MVGQPSAADSSVSVTVEQDPQQPDPTNDPVVRFVVQFSAEVTGFDLADVLVEGSASAQVSHLNPIDATTYSVEVTAPSSGMVVVRIPQGAAVDILDNANDASTSIDNQVRVDIDPPSLVLEQADLQADPTNSPLVRFIATFSEPVDGFDATDVVVTGSGLGVVDAVVANGPTSYEVTVLATADGVVDVAVADGAAIDAAGNTSQAAQSVDAQVTVLTAPLNVTVDQAPGQADPVNATSAEFVVTFSQAVADFTESDLVIGGTATPTTVALLGGPEIYTVTVGGVGQDGTVTVTVVPGAARDAAGNVSADAVVIDGQVTLDTTDPAAVSLLEPAAGSTITSLAPVFDWSDGTDATGVTYLIESDNNGCGFPSAEIIAANLVDSTFAPSRNLTRATYCWRVTTIDGAGNRTGSATRSFTIGPGLPDAVDVATSSGIERTFQSFGESCASDVNGDGHTDLFISNHGGWAWQLYYGSATGQFTEVAVGVFPRNDRHGCAIADFNADGRMDIYTTIGACSGTQFCNKNNELWLQNSTGGFTNQTVAWGVGDRRGRGRATAAFDFNKDAYPDLVVGNDVGIYYDSPNRVFVGGANGMTELISPVTAELGGESVDAADYDGDGWTDLLVGTGPRGAKLYRNINGTTFVDVSAATGLSGIRSAWDAEFADFNADGKPDIAVVERAMLHVRLNVAGTFPSSDYSRPLQVGRNLAVGDVDGDTHPDLYIVQGATPSTNVADLLLMNDGQAHFSAVGGLPNTTTGGGDSVQRVPNWLGSGRDGFLVTNGNTRYGPRQLVVFPGELRPPQPPPPPPPPSATVKHPATVAVLTGASPSGTAAALAKQGGTVYSVKSVKPAGQSIQQVGWRADFSNVVRTAGSLRLQYRGLNTLSCTQQVSVWNWTTSVWVVLDTQTVGNANITTAELALPGPLTAYVSGTASKGTVRARVSCSGGATALYSKADLFKLVVS